MITNERQRRITRAEIKRFEDALARTAAQEPAAGVDPRVHQAMIDGLQSQLDDLRQELNEYEALREGKLKRRVLTSLHDLPTALIEGRIVRRLTQRELARKLGVPEQQVQRYEKTGYAGASIERLQDVADALGMRFKNTVEYDVRTPARTDVRTSEKGERKSGSRPPSAGSRVSRSSSASRLSEGKKKSSTASRRGDAAAGRKVGNAAAMAPGKTFASRSARPAAKRAPASDRAQMKNQKISGEDAASTSARKSVGKTATRAGGPDLHRSERALQQQSKPNHD